LNTTVIGPDGQNGAIPGNTTTDMEYDDMRNNVKTYSRLLRRCQNAVEIELNASIRTIWNAIGGARL